MKSWERELEERTALAACAGPREAVPDLGCWGSPCCGVCAGGSWTGLSQPRGVGGVGWQPHTGLEKGQVCSRVLRCSTAGAGAPPRLRVLLQISPIPWKVWGAQCSPGRGCGKNPQAEFDMQVTAGEEPGS